MSTFTLAILKPDCVQRGLVGAVINRMEGASLVPSRIRLVQPDQWDPHRLYTRQHESEPYFAPLVLFMSSGPVVLVEVRQDKHVHLGETAVTTWRKIMGRWQDAGRDTTIRGLHMIPGCRPMENLVHGSDSTQSFMYEMSVVGHLL